MSEWTVGFWFSLSSVDTSAHLPWQVSNGDLTDLIRKEKQLNQTLFEMQFPGGPGRDNVVSECKVINKNGRLSCSRTGISIDLASLQAERWYYFVLDSRGFEHRIRLFNKQWQLLSDQRTQSNSPIGLTNMQLKVGYGLKGSIKRFTVFEYRVDGNDALKPFAFSHLYPLSN